MEGVRDGALVPLYVPLGRRITLCKSLIMEVGTSIIVTDASCEARHVETDLISVCNRSARLKRQLDLRRLAQSIGLQGGEGGMGGSV